MTDIRHVDHANKQGHHYSNVMSTSQRDVHIINAASYI
jgi:hypothetical protein